MKKIMIGSPSILAALAMAAMTRPITVHVSEDLGAAPPVPEPEPRIETRQQRRARERALAKAERRKA